MRICLCWKWPDKRGFSVKDFGLVVAYWFGVMVVF
jgi:hypothetical protein